MDNGSMAEEEGLSGAKRAAGDPEALQLPPPKKFLSGNQNDFTAMELDSVFRSAPINDDITPEEHARGHEHEPLTLGKPGKPNDENSTLESLKQIIPDLFEDSNVKSLLSVDDCKRLIENFCNEQFQVAVDAFLVVQRLASFSVQQVERLLGFGALGKIEAVLDFDDSDDFVVLEACRLVSIITEKTGCKVIKALAATSIIDSLATLSLDGHIVLVREASKGLSNVFCTAILGQSPELLSILDDKGVVDALLYISQYNDFEVENVCLNGFRKVLQKYRPEITNRFPETDENCFDKEKLIDEGWDPEFFLAMIVKIRRVVEETCYGRFTENQELAADILGYFEMSSILSNLPGMEWDQSEMVSHEIVGFLAE